MLRVLAGATGNWELRAHGSLERSSWQPTAATTAFSTTERRWQPNMVLPGGTTRKLWDSGIFSRSQFVAWSCTYRTPPWTTWQSTAELRQPRCVCGVNFSLRSFVGETRTHLNGTQKKQHRANNNNSGNKKIASVCSVFLGYPQRRTGGTLCKYPTENLCGFCGHFNTLLYREYL